MTAASNVEPVSWDPYNPVYFKNPYPIFRRLREEAPLYYNEEHGFYAVSRYADCERAMRDKDAFSSARGAILEIIKANIELPEAVFIFQDPPIHTAYRNLITRAMSPKRMNALEAQVRAYCAACLDPLVGQDRFDFITDLGAKMPTRVISMLLGIPEEDQEAVRQSGDDRLRTEAGKPMDVSLEVNFEGSAYSEYIDWRMTHPSDDMMSELLQTEFKDPSGTVRKLTKDEILNLVNLIAGAGNETTNRLIGWTGKELAEHPDQRREIVQNPALIPQTVEELLRFQTPGPAIGRTLTRDVELYDTKIPSGSIMMVLVGAGNRDDRRFPDGDSFNIHREQRPHLGFGHGIHVCIGAVLARLEGRVALEETLKRFPEWHVDYDHAELAQTSTVRGWETLPVFVGPAPKKGAARPVAVAAPAAAPVEKVPDAPFAGTWKLTVKGPTGAENTVLVIENKNGSWNGTQTGQGTTSPLTDITVDNNKVSWINHITKPIKVKVHFSGEISGNNMTGKVKVGFIGSFSFTAVKQ